MSAPANRFNLEEVVVDPAVQRVLSQDMPSSPLENLQALQVFENVSLEEEPKRKLAARLTQMINQPYQDQEVIGRCYAIANKHLKGVFGVTSGQVGLFSGNPLEQAVIYDKEPVLRYHLQNGPKTLEGVRDPLRRYAQTHSSEEFASELYALYQNQPKVVIAFLREEQIRLQAFLSEGESERYCDQLFTLLQLHDTYQRLGSMVFMSYDQKELLEMGSEAIQQTLALLHQNPGSLILSLTHVISRLSGQIEEAKDLEALQELHEKTLKLLTHLEAAKRFLIDFERLAPHAPSGLLARLVRLIKSKDELRADLQSGMARLLEYQTEKCKTDLSCVDALLKKIDNKIQFLEEAPAAGIKRKKK